MRTTTQSTHLAAVLSTGLLLLGCTGSLLAKTVHTRVHAGLKSSMHLRTHTVVPLMRGEEVVPGVMPESASAGTDDETVQPSVPEMKVPEVKPSSGKLYSLKLFNLHTGESLNVLYRIGNVYVPEALDKLNYFLRDRHTEDIVRYEPKEFDVLHALLSRLGRSNGFINVVCGYRTPETNEALRNASPNTGVAEHSQHMEGHAIDLSVPGVSTVKLRNAALSLRAGGVGYYPVSQFVHVDVGPVREWAFGRSPRKVGRRPHRGHASSAVGQ